MYQQRTANVVQLQVSHERAVLAATVRRLEQIAANAVDRASRAREALLRNGT